MSVVFPPDTDAVVLAEFVGGDYDPEVRAGAYRALRALGSAALGPLQEVESRTRGPGRQRLVRFRRRLVDRLIDEWLAQRPKDPGSVTP